MPGKEKQGRSLLLANHSIDMTSTLYCMRTDKNNNKISISIQKIGKTYLRMASVISSTISRTCSFSKSSPKLERASTRTLVLNSVIFDCTKGKQSFQYPDVMLLELFLSTRKKRAVQSENPFSWNAM